MINHLKYRIVIILFSANLIYSFNAVADNNQTQLNHIVEQIKNIKNNLLQKNNKRDSLQKELDKIETQYGDTSEKCQRIKQQVSEHKVKIKVLENASLLDQNQIQLQKQALAEQLRLSYLLQQQGSVKLILNQEDLNQTTRMLFYYQKLNLYRTKTISQLEEDIERINDRQQQLYVNYQLLKTLQEQQQQEENKLTVMKDNRTQLITKISQNIQNQNQQLNSLSNNKKRLEQTLVKLTHIKTNTFPGNFSNKIFSSQRGHLPWPTKGSVLHYFNTPIAQSEIKWNAELIEAPDGQPVYAIAPGAVVFSKWLEGYGLLIIINHGGGYMTLYGRNHSLVKHEGDKVLAGEVIATVGQSGGYDKPALYFAIRYNAKPLDPSLWCSQERL